MGDTQGQRFIHNFVIRGCATTSGVTQSNLTLVGSSFPLIPLHAVLSLRLSYPLPPLLLPISFDRRSGVCTCMLPVSELLDDAWVS